MAFALGFAGGFADAGAEPEPEPTPGIIGRGSGSPLYQRRWVTRPGQPAPPPVRLAVSVHVAYRWAASVTRILPKVRHVQPAPRLSSRVTALTTGLRAVGVAARTSAKVVDLTVNQMTIRRVAAEIRELNEIAFALTAWQ